MRARTKEELLAHYATGEVYQYIQMDGDYGRAPNMTGIDASDENGDTVYGAISYALRHIKLPVRVQFLRGTDLVDVVRLLRKMVDWLEKDPDWVERQCEYADEPGKVKQEVHDYVVSEAEKKEADE